LGSATQAPPQNVPEAISALPPVGTLPSPWTTWLYLTLMAYRRRQQWGKDLLREHLPQTVPSSQELRQRCQPVEAMVTPKTATMKPGGNGTASAALPPATDTPPKLSLVTPIFQSTRKE
jgi:hypothetical protein